MGRFLMSLEFMLGSSSYGFLSLGWMLMKAQIRLNFMWGFCPRVCLLICSRLFPLVRIKGCKNLLCFHQFEVKFEFLCTLFYCCNDKRVKLGIWDGQDLLNFDFTDHICFCEWIW